MSEASVIFRVDRVAMKLRTVALGHLRAFGAENHNFLVNQPVTKHQLAAFEARYSIELPIEYRQLITHLGNGGAGPAYGMFALERTLPKSSRIQVPDDFLRTSFPYAGAYNPEDDPEEKRFWECVDQGEISDAECERRTLYQRAGTLDLCDEGCGHLHFLVVTGLARGQMWVDSRCSDQGFFPLGVGFLDWYERWLDSILAGGDGVWWMEDQQE